MSLGPIWNLITLDFGVDLGTANTLVYIKGQGVVRDDPTVIAIHKKTKTTVAIGQQAKQMIGRTPEAINTIQPVANGVIVDFEATQRLIQHHINQLHRSSSRKLVLNRPRVVIGVPSLVTAVERRAVVDAARKSGAREVYIVDESMASALGCGLLNDQAQGRLLIDIGGGTTEIAVASLDGLVVNKSVSVAGWAIDQAIINHSRETYQLLIGSQTAENLKLEVGQATKPEKPKTAMLRGRDISSGLPKGVRVDSQEIQAIIEPILDQIAVAVQEVLIETPPELAADISHSGATIAGGGALLPGIAEYFTKKLEIPAQVADKPLQAVVNGLAILLDDRRLLQQIALPLSKQHED